MRNLWLNEPPDSIVEFEFDRWMNTLEKLRKDFKGGMFVEDIYDLMTSIYLEWVYHHISNRTAFKQLVSCAHIMKQNGVKTV